MAYPIITISREFGSGGHSIGEKVAEALGVPFYDSKIVTDVVKASGFDADYISDKGEYLSAGSRWFSGLIPNEMYTESPQTKIFNMQCDVILKAAEKGPCVIVGRCADYVLSDNEKYRTLNVFIRADKEHRMERALERYENSNVSIEKRLQQKDKERKNYYSYYTNRTWGDINNYQLCLDSGYLGEEKCVEIIVDAAKAHDK